MNQQAAELSGEARRTLLASILDELVPPSSDGRLPGAGALGVGDFIDRELEGRPEIAPFFEFALSSIEELAQRRDTGGFVASSRQDRVEVLREFEASQPDLFGAIVMFTYAGYYSQRRISELLGLRPHPQPDGYDLEAGDLDALLKPVRQRPGKLYREC
jgi:hypothetical protein